MVELIHVFLFAICCTLALLLTFRLPFPSPITLVSLRIGLTLVLADDLIRFGFPEVNAIAAPRGRQLRGANDLVAHDSAAIRATDINAEGVILDPAIGDGGVV